MHSFLTSIDGATFTQTTITKHCDRLDGNRCIISNKLSSNLTQNHIFTQLQFTPRKVEHLFNFKIYFHKILPFSPNYLAKNSPDFGVLEEGDGGSAGEGAVPDLSLLRQIVGGVDRGNLHKS